MPITQMPTMAIPSAAQPKELESCFKYYTFGSVDAQISGRMSRVSQGTDFGISGTLTNHNPYPIVDAAVWVKVFKKRPDPTAKNVNGPDVVDMIKVVDHITLRAGESRPFSFVWNVPPDAQPGDYRMVSFVDGSQQFSLLGLTFTDDIVGDSFDFSIVGHDFGTVRFGKESVHINGQPFYFAAFPPQVDASTTDVTVTANIANTATEPTAAQVSWKLYYWDSTIPAHLLTNETKQYIIGAKSSGAVSFTITDTTHTVYYLVGELTEHSGSKSVIGVRFVRSGVSMPRLAFVGVNSYPVATSSTAFTCIHSTNNTEVENATLTLSVLTKGFFGTTTVISKTYRGAIPGDMLAFALPFATKLSSFSIAAELYQNGKLVESKIVPYRCEDLQDVCPTSGNAFILNFNSITITYWLVGVAFMILIALIAGLYILRKKKFPDTVSSK